MITDRISFYGLSDLMLIKGTMNDFMYSKALELFKENYDSFEEKNLYFEQDEATDPVFEIIPQWYLHSSPALKFSSFPI